MARSTVVISPEPKQPATGARVEAAPMANGYFVLAVPTRATASVASAAVAPRRTLRALTRRRVLRPFDQLVGLNEGAVLVLRDELEADATTVLVDLLNDDVEHVAAGDHVLDMADPPGADVRDVEEPVRALLELDERAEVGRLDDLARVGVPHLGLLGDRLDRLDRGGRLRAL